jgi:hypothetical protein
VRYLVYRFASQIGRKNPEPRSVCQPPHPEG